jgi:hypothetical protein
MIEKKGVHFSRRHVVIAAAAAATCGSPRAGAGENRRDAPAAPDPFDRARLAEHLRMLDSAADLRSGSPGDLALAAALAQHLERAGFSLSRQVLQTPHFKVGASRLQSDRESVDVVPQEIVTSTGPKGVEGRLRVFSPGDDPRQLRGTIALVMLPHGRHSQLTAPAVSIPLDAALSGDPVAVVLITNGPTGETIMLNAPLRRPYAAKPIAVLGPKPGAGLLASARDGKRARLVIDGAAGVRETVNILARIDRGGPLLVVSTPRTAWTPAVAERGPGIAAFLSLADWAPTALPRTSLLFVNTGAHEFDNAGGLHFLTSDQAPDQREVALWVHLGAGFAARAHHDLGGGRLLPLSSPDPQRFLLGTEDLLPALRDGFRGQPGLEDPYPVSAGAAGELAEIAAAGYRPVFGLFGAHLRHHTMNDRLAMTDPGWLREAVLAVRGVIAGRF